MTVDDRVRHLKFGFGRILELTGKTALVESETHRVVREFDRPVRTPLEKHHSHVNVPLLRPAPATRD